MATIILFVAGIIIIYSTGITNINSITMLKEYFYNNGGLLIFSMFFIVVPVYAWILLIKNKVIKPKKEVLYLLCIDDNNICSFLDIKGKKYFLDNNNYEIEKFYEVLKTKDKIDQVIGISNEIFDVVEVKENYWLNFYSPVGNFENLLVLPILYIILLIGLLSIMMSKGMDKLCGLLFIMTPLFGIIYDGIYKIKKIGLREDEAVDTKVLDKIYELIPYIISIIACLGINIWLFIGLLSMKNTVSRLTMLPFCLITLSILLYQIFQIFKKDNIVDIIGKLMIIIFLVFWFSFSLFVTVISIKGKTYEMLIIIIPFYLAGIYIVYDNFIKKK